jgi:hypothetical protein
MHVPAKVQVALAEFQAAREAHTEGKRAARAARHRYESATNKLALELARAGQRRRRWVSTGAA